MIETPGLIIPGKDDINNVFIQKNYAIVTRFVRKNYNYIFEGPEGSTKNLLIGEWSKNVCQSEVLKHGT